MVIGGSPGKISESTNHHAELQWPVTTFRVPICRMYPGRIRTQWATNETTRPCQVNPKAFALSLALIRSNFDSHLMIIEIFPRDESDAFPLLRQPGHLPSPLPSLACLPAWFMAAIFLPSLPWLPLPESLAAWSPPSHISALSPGLDRKRRRGAEGSRPFL